CLRRHRAGGGTWWVDRGTDLTFVGRPGGALPGIRPARQCALGRAGGAPALPGDGPGGRAADRARGGWFHRPRGAGGCGRVVAEPALVPGGLERRSTGVGPATG